jgi:hypothetical protein
MTLPTRVPLLLVTIYVALIGLISPVSTHPDRSGPIHVHNGNSIQAAIDSAKPYDHIIVEAGNYNEQLTISKDGITLIGHNAILIPPSSPKANICSGLAGSNAITHLDTQTGICITGYNVVLAPFLTDHRKFVSVERRVKDVSVTGFSVSGFDGINIAIVGAKDTSVCDNTLTDGANYGVLTVGSKNSVIERNTVVSTPPIAPNTFLSFIGICMDDVSPVTIAYNSINGYNIGLCVQTNGANIHDNYVQNCCIGAYVDPGVNGVKLQGNEVRDTNPLCKEDVTVSGAFAVWGIAIVGSSNTLVKGNRISGITAFGQNKGSPAAGIAVMDDLPGGTGDLGSGNTVVHNKIVHNDVDLQVSATGAGNVENHNVCKVSLPTGLCK